MLHLRPSDYRVMPWKDGGGSTTEIAIEPAGASLSDPFLWRVSSARVETSGPFSRFPDRARLLTLLDGSGLLLDIGGQGPQRLERPGQVVAFDGGVPVDARLIQGPCLDLGVISDPGRVKAALQWLDLGAEGASITVAPATLLFAPRGAVRVDPLGVELQSGDCLRLGNDPAAAEAPGAKLDVRSVSGTAPLAVITLCPV